MIPSFQVTRLPNIVFGAGEIRRAGQFAMQYGPRVLLVTGARSFRDTPHWLKLNRDLEERGAQVEELVVSGEPSPQLVDAAVRDFYRAEIQVVVAIGGGSVLDAAKAIAGLLPHGNSVMDHLEGVGPERPYRGPAVPLIAIPTTAGTGSEATKNAVLSVRGADGFKKSFRDEQLVPKLALVDPELLASCPRPLIAANGMDALTQLLESYVSVKANPFSDALAWSGLETVRDGLLPWYEGAADAAAARSRMAYGALISGITLAQVGLGSVHGLASPLGAFFPIPHGVVCGTLVAAATAINIRALQSRAPQHPSLEKYAQVGRLFSGNAEQSDDAARAALVTLLSAWTERLGLPRLAYYDITARDFPRIIAACRGSSMKTNPIVLEDREVEEVLSQRL